MAVIDVRSDIQTCPSFRYSSKYIPRIGETITCFDPAISVKVLKVDYLIKNKLSIGTHLVEDLVTLTVEPVEGE